MADLVVNVRDFRVGRRYVLPDDVVYVGRPGRGLKGSPFANPFRIGDRWYGPHGFDYGTGEREMSRPEVLSAYITWFDDAVARGELDPEPLRGRRLACWCRPERCHADTIVSWLVAHPPLPVAGEPVVFGLHAMAAAVATDAPAWLRAARSA